MLSVWSQPSDRSPRSILKIKNNPNLIRYSRFKCIQQSKPYSGLKVRNLKKKGIVKIHEDVTHQQTSRNLLRFVSMKNGPHFGLERIQRLLKSVILAEYFAMRTLNQSSKISYHNTRKNRICQNFIYIHSAGHPTINLYPKYYLPGGKNQNSNCVKSR